MIRTAGVTAAPARPRMRKPSDDTSGPSRSPVLAAGLVLAAMLLLIVVGSMLRMQELEQELVELRSTAAVPAQPTQATTTDAPPAVLDDLLRRADLIPHAPTLGGRMQFVIEESRVLNEHWVLAAYEDGHIRGQMLLEYAIDKDGTVAWRVLAAYLD
jgi:hypothetical protein